MSIPTLALYAAGAIIGALAARYLEKVREASLKNEEPVRAASERKKEIAERFGRPFVQTNPYEDVIACGVVNPDNLEVKFEVIGGLNSVKQALYELVILPLQRPELFTFGKLLGPQKGVLLYGPPGTGKTTLAKAIAKESGAVFINVKFSDLVSKWFGEAQKLVAAVFSLANKLQPAIIFIDEVDSFLGERSNSDQATYTSMKTEFMALWDGMTTDQNARVMVLAATNRPSELDAAILRRFPQKFEIGLPDRRDRAEILKFILKCERVENIDFDFLASLSDGYSGSDLFELCKKAAYLPIRELLDDEKSGKLNHVARPLKQTDFEQVLISSKKTNVAAHEYSELLSESSSYPIQKEREDIKETEDIMEREDMKEREDIMEREDIPVQNMSSFQRLFSPKSLFFLFLFFFLFFFFFLQDVESAV